MATAPALVERDPEEQRQIIDAFAATVEHHCPRGAGYEEIGHEDGRLWDALATGGWLDVGALSAGEDAQPLETLALLAIEWGRRLPRLPFAASVLSRRWYAVPPGDATPHAIALPARDGIVAPFAGTADVVLLDAQGDAHAMPPGETDAFDPTLPLLRAPAADGLVPRCASELQLLLAAQALGAAREALDRAAAYAGERRAFGRPVSAFQSLRHWLADMHIAYEQGLSTLYWALSTTGAERHRALGECSRQAQQVAQRAVQVFGGVGCSWELGIHAYLRHAVTVRELCRAPAPSDAGEERPLTTRAPDDEAFRADVRAWLRSAMPPEWRERAATSDHNEVAAMKSEWASIRQRGGYSGMRWPKAHGGRGWGPLETMVYYEEAALAGAPEGVDNNPRAIGLDLAGPAIIAFGTEAQKAHLPRILGGEEIWCEGFSEPGAGSDLAAVATTALWDGEAYRVNGSKIWTTYAHLADYCYLLAKTSTELPRKENLSVFLFDMRQPGVEVRPILNLAGEHEFNQVFFDNAVATPADLLGELNGGWKMVTIGAKALRSSGSDGGTTVAWQRCVLLATWIARLRAGIADPVALARVAALDARLSALRWTNARNAGITGPASAFPLVAGGSNIVKLGISEVLQEITELALEVAPAADREFWRREYLLARARTLAGGSSQIQRDVIANQIMQLPKA